jgi:hypothetical protein
MAVWRPHRNKENPEILHAELHEVQIELRQEYRMAVRFRLEAESPVPLSVKPSGGGFVDFITAADGTFSSFV